MHPIKAMRESRTMTQQTLALAACVSLSTVKRAEAGKSISKESMLSIASVLETEPRLIAPASPRPFSHPAVLVRNGLLLVLAAHVFLAVNFTFVDWIDGLWLDFVMSSEGLPFREAMSDLPIQVSLLIVTGRLVVNSLPSLLMIFALAYAIHRYARARAGRDEAGGLGR